MGAATAEVSAMERVISGDVVAARERVSAERTHERDGKLRRGQGALVTVLDASRDLRDLRMQELAARARLGLAWAELRHESASDRHASRAPSSFG